MLRLLFITVFVLLSSVSFSRKDIDSTQIKAQCAEIAENWLDHYLVLIRNTPGYSPPVAARTLAYISTGMYESMLGLMPENRSMSSQLEGLEFTIPVEDYEPIDHRIVLNRLNYELALYFFENMPPKEREQLDEWRDSIASTFGHVKGKRRKKSESMAIYIAGEIINWSKKDGGDQGWNKNFPSTYVPPVCDSCWKKTSPGYTPAMLPYWGNNVHLVESNQQVCNDIPYIPFSTDSTSAFYVENKIIQNLYKVLTHEQEVIAEYWDDSPGVSGTPVGHMFAIALQLCEANKLSFSDEFEMFMLLGLSINEAVIESWKLKYHFNLIRPITYIQRYIQADFHTAIATPPFPEFPSGHSFQAGSASIVLKQYFSDTVSVTDRSNNYRTDIDGSTRTFNSISQMAEEMSISRLYGGIHYTHTLDVSLEYGRRIAGNTLNHIVLKK